MALLACLGACSPQGPRRVVEPRVPPQNLSALARDLSAAVTGLDDNDLRRAAEAQYVALEFGRPGQPTPWRNPDTGHSGEVIPGAATLPAAPGTCRSLRHTFYVGGSSQTIAMEACRDATANWLRRGS